MEEKIKHITYMMDLLIEDNTIPRNIRKAVSEAKEKLLSEGDPTVNIASAIYILDEISNDINMPLHARTDIWNIISELEKLKEEIR